MSILSFFTLNEADSDTGGGYSSLGVSNNRGEEEISSNCFIKKVDTYLTEEIMSKVTNGTSIKGKKSKMRNSYQYKLKESRLFGIE